MLNKLNKKIHIHIHTYTNTYIITHTHTHIHNNKHTHTHIHNNTHTHTHTHIHSVEKWQRKWDQTTKGAITHEYFPVVAERLKMKINITQNFTTLVTGHGNIR